MVELATDRHSKLTELPYDLTVDIWPMIGHMLVNDCRSRNCWNYGRAHGTDLIAYALGAWLLQAGSQLYGREMQDVDSLNLASGFTLLYDESAIRIYRFSRFAIR